MLKALLVRLLIKLLVKLLAINFKLEYFGRKIFYAFFLEHILIKYFVILFLL